MTSEQPAPAPFVRTALALWVLGLVGVAMISPYILEIEGPTLAAAAKSAHTTVDRLLIASLVQAGVLVGICTFLGLWAARAVGLRTPVLSALLTGQRLPRLGGPAAVSIVVGALSGLAILALDAYVFRPGPKLSLVSSAPIEAWKGALASFYGGFTEELFLRLFLLSVIAVALQALATGGKPRSRPLMPWAFWSANLVSAVVFGLGHLPATEAVAPLTTLILIRALVLNGLAGVACGALYWVWGLEFAMFAHFSADLVVHVAAPLIFGR